MSSRGRTQFNGSVSSRSRSPVAVTNLQQYRVDELREMARDLNIPGRSRMRKEELIAAINGGGTVMTRARTRSRSPTRSTSPRARSNWQQLVSETSRQYGISAAQAAKMLGPNYTSQAEQRAMTVPPRPLSTSSFQQRSRSPVRQQRMACGRKF